jgi:hypothetical protein
MVGCADGGPTGGTTTAGVVTVATDEYGEYPPSAVDAFW